MYTIKQNNKPVQFSSKREASKWLESSVGLKVLLDLNAGRYTLEGEIQKSVRHFVRSNAGVHEIHLCSEGFLVASPSVSDSEFFKMNETFFHVN